ncbi:MAG: SDR family oxidoreductase [Bdellovibrionales bacterium]|nr:SDR family oxidoreductase [Bdellovibrionales bacterium]
MPRDTKGRRPTIVVTGASAGVGRATARMFAKKQGARLALLARDERRLKKTADEVRVLGGEAMVLPLDVANASAVDDAAAEVEQQLGPVDIWVNNAMVSVFSPIRRISPEEFKRVTEVTYLGQVYGTLAALRRMLPRDRGTIVLVGSALAFRGIPLQAPYCAAKHAVKGFADSLRAELLHDGSRVKVSSVHLPALNTPQFDWVKSRLKNQAQPVPPIFQPEVAARAICWASLHPRPELLVGGSTLRAVLASKLLPRVVDYYLAKTGYRSQQTDEPETEQREGNLWEPVPGPYAAHGRFDARATSFSPQLWMNTHRTSTAAIGVALGAAAYALASRTRHDRNGVAR